MNVHTHHVLPTVGFAHPKKNLESLGIEPGMLVADFGAGSGHYVVQLAQLLGKSGRVYAIDVQKDLLRRIHTEAHKHGLLERIEFIWGDLESPKGSKIADRRLDLVLISNLLFQVPDKTAIIREARRILKSSGRLAIIDWKESFGGMGPQREDVVTKEAALELMHSNGFELIREFDAGAHHYGLLLGQLLTARTQTQLHTSL
ncbi:MAG TPA: methyltransferase domain-containing protein [Candidatus Paceibacterota bacterium]|nr:methyltransferase domain-containing protein [Candidatus Paceibacterota bacterium]